jgi:hypothetical protein
MIADTHQHGAGRALLSRFLILAPASRLVFLTREVSATVIPRVLSTPPLSHADTGDASLRARAVRAGRCSPAWVRREA